MERYLRRHFGESDFVEDCVQECLLAIHRARATFDPARRFRPWMFAIVRHKAIDMLRRRGTRRRHETQDAHEEEPTAPGSSPGRRERDRNEEPCSPGNSTAKAPTRRGRGLTCEAVAI
jgi:RNA polymerase sigma-70 factor (ECF subfamily)